MPTTDELLIFRTLPAWLSLYQRLGEDEFHPALLDLNALDKWLDDAPPPQTLAGLHVDWHGQVARTRLLANQRLVIDVQLTCARCQQATTVVPVMSGLHMGAFCYVCNENGDFEADLRDQEWVCNECTSRRQHGSQA